MGTARDTTDPTSGPARWTWSAWAAIALVGALAAAGCPGGATTGDVIADELARSARDHGPRAALESAARRIEAALAVGDDAHAGEVLTGAWPIGGGLADDRALRELLDRLPDAAVPPALRPARAVEDAQQALEDGRPELARELLRRSPEPATGDVRTTLRRRIIETLIASTQGAPLARSRLARVAHGDAPEGGALAAELQSLAVLTLAASWLDEGDLKQAIADFLRVPATSGYWRQARFGLATCQLRAGRPESALKVLALLPGGFVAEPERALMSAAAAHAIGRPEDAVAIVDAALERRGLWYETAMSPIAVELEVLRLEVRRDLPDDDTLVTVTAATPAVRAALSEVAATRAARATAAGPDAEALARWEERVARIAKDVIRRELAARARAADERFSDLETLRPQLEQGPTPDPDR